MYRKLLDKIKDWEKESDRMPLVLRGARQVGKSTLVRNFAKEAGLHLCEINLEKFPELDETFAKLNVEKIVKEIEILINEKIGPNSLLFLDEIQATPHALPALRYFYEEKKNLPVIAAGSLLEFVLAKHSFSMPVGRIQYLHMGPMDFEEFLLAQNEKILLDEMSSYQWNRPWSQALHARLSELQREYLFVGGMPKAVKTYQDTKSLFAIQKVHQTIIDTYRDDFSKYGTKEDLLRLHKIFSYAARSVGKKVKYSAIADDDTRALKRNLDLLSLAQVINKVTHSDCSGIPLSVDTKESVFKLLFLDTGLANHICGIDWTFISKMTDVEVANEGALAEQFIGQQLVYYYSIGRKSPVHYWLREGKKENAEVDFVIACGNEIIPVEIKSGTSGQLKSLQQFIYRKNLKRAVKFDLNEPSRFKVEHDVVRMGGASKIKFELMSLPLYMVGQLPRLLQHEA